jgi:hypothetical protein
MVGFNHGVPVCGVLGHGQAEAGRRPSNRNGSTCGLGWVGEGNKVELDSIDWARLQEKMNFEFKLILKLFKNLEND